MNHRPKIEPKMIKFLEHMGRNHCELSLNKFFLIKTKKKDFLSSHLPNIKQEFQALTKHHITSLELKFDNIVKTNIEKSPLNRKHCNII